MLERNKPRVDHLLIVLETKKPAIKVPEGLVCYEDLYLIDGPFRSVSSCDRKG